MTVVFADSFYFFAILNPRDSAHAAAVAFSSVETRGLMSTTSVLTEVADGLAGTRNRRMFSLLLAELDADPKSLVVHPTFDVFGEAAELYERMRDKEWSLTDCVSFVIMREHEVQNAWTGDKHFRQAGFVTLAP